MSDLLEYLLLVLLILIPAGVTFTILNVRRLRRESFRRARQQQKKSERSEE